jgi:hypothetical protein
MWSSKKQPSDFSIFGIRTKQIIFLTSMHIYTKEKARQLFGRVPNGRDKTPTSDARSKFYDGAAFLLRGDFTPILKQHKGKRKEKGGGIQIREGAIKEKG